ncbi:MAG: endolytic transglycosylase MltG [Eubacteriales bacterium]|nr:endolytic transglycosylase MltG [Eubacteriales bacterium]
MRKKTKESTKEVKEIVHQEQERMPSGEKKSVGDDGQATVDERGSAAKEGFSGESKQVIQIETEQEQGRKKRSRQAAPKRKFRLLTRGALLLIFIGLSLALTFAFSMWREYTRTESEDGHDVVVVIEEGSTTKQVGKLLKEAGVIRYQSVFYLKMYFSEYRGKLRYGEFLLNDGMCMEDVIVALATGGAQKKEKSFTIPEGYSVPMIARKLEREQVMPAEEFLTAVRQAAGDAAWAGELPAADQVLYQLEGYLFPDTYYLSENMTGAELVHKILEEFQKKMTAERREKAAALGMSVEEVLTRASLVQKETERVEEYPTVAGVINNRLAQNMYLQFDSTVVYALSEGMYGVDRVLYAHLEVDSPYNTYKKKGLPPGPICNPSLEAIDGVLNPQAHEYLYFQTDQVKDDGSNLYFKTYEEHAAAAATTQVGGGSSGEETTAASEQPSTTAE